MPKTKKGYKEIKQQVARFKAESVKSKKFREQQLKRRKLKAKYLEETPEEKHLWDLFRRIVLGERKQHRDKNPDIPFHFSFHHIFKLDLLFDLVIVMGGKNIGKTWAQAMFVRDEIAKDPNIKFFFMRTTKEELEKGFKAQLETGEEWPIQLVVKSGILKWKKFEPRPKGVLKEGDYQIGYATYVSGFGLKAKQGASYKNLKYCIWDEFNDDGSGSLKASYKEDLLRFFLSLQRENKDFKLFMCGNLLSDANHPVSHVMLQEFGIPFDAKLKYITVKHEDSRTNKIMQFRLLYINTGEAGDLYDGVASQNFSLMFGADASEDLRTNQPAQRTSKIVSLIAFYDSEPWFSFVVTFEKLYYCIYIGQIKIKWTEQDVSYYYVLHVNYYTKDNTELGYTPVCDEIETTNLFGMLLKVWDESISEKFQTLQMIMEAGALYFTSDPVKELFCTKLYPFLEKKYTPYLKDWF